MARVFGVCVVIAFIAVLPSRSEAQTAQAHYDRFCAGCHSASFTTPSTRAELPSSEQIVRTILDGNLARGMPSFRSQLSEPQASELASLISRQNAESPRLGRTVDAEALNKQRSAGFTLMATDASAYVGYFGERSSLCYSKVDLTGVRSIELNYAKGSDDAGRFAVLIGDGISTAQNNLAEQNTHSTGGWTTFNRRRIGLSKETTGVHELCFYGVQGGGIFNLDSFTLSAEPGEHDAITFKVEEVAPSVLAAAGYRFALEKIADAPSEVWSAAFLSDGSLVLAQKSGQLLLWKEGKFVGHVQGIPAVWNGGQGGLMQVKPHPQHSRNGWIYLSFSDPGGNNATAMTRIVRGKLQGLNWMEQQDIYRAANRFYTQDYAHFGSRMAFDNGYIYFSVGERQNPERAQDLSFPYGKIHRLFDDGRVPQDNPFVGRSGALRSVWTYGHRNPQGMTRHAKTGEIWAAEHGPKGGDEINLVRKGRNYGWPLVSHGTHYDGKAVGPSAYRDGIEPPVHHYTPSIAISQIEYYDSDEFPEWKGALFVASLGQQELHLLRLENSKVVSDQLLFKGFGRIRDVIVGPDGHPYVVLNQFGGAVYRMRPIEQGESTLRSSLKH